MKYDEWDMLLSTPRLLLRDFAPSDAPAMAALHADPRWQRFYEDHDCTPERSQELVRMFVETARETPRTKFQLALVVKPDGALIGSCGVRKAAVADREAEFGCEIDPRRWRQGYASEAAGAILEHAFVELGLHRVWSRVVAANAAAVRVAERAGMRLEGRLKQHQWIRGRWEDTLLYAILEDEWRNGRPANRVQES